MGGEVAGDCDQDMAAFFAPAPFPVLPHTGLEHLISMKICILAQNRSRQCGDQLVDWVAARQVAGDQAAGIAHRSLAIERREKRAAQRVTL